MSYDLLPFLLPSVAQCSFNSKMLHFSETFSLLYLVILIYELNNIFLTKCTL